MAFTLSQSLSGLLASVPLSAQEVFSSGSPLHAFVTNSTVVSLIVLVVLLWFVRGAMKRRQTIPGTRQNLVEFGFEKVYGLVEGMLGEKVAKRAFPLLGTLFVFILVANWFGLFPGVGTIGFAHETHGALRNIHGEDHSFAPLLRPANADINMTLGMALCAMVLWFILTIQEIGFMGFIKHTFGSKGGLKGFLGAFVAAVFLFVGVIEIVSILARPLTLSLRLFGNLFAGENLLHAMGDMLKNTGNVGAFLGRVLLPLPFYFLEILVGLLQAFVFTLLCTVYILLTTHHDEEHGEEHAH